MGCSTPEGVFVWVAPNASFPTAMAYICSTPEGVFVWVASAVAVDRP